MPKFAIVLLTILIIMIIALIVLYFVGKRAQKKKEEQDAQIAAAAQTISMLIIDKKKMRLKDSGLPANVIAQTPKMLRRSKLPIVSGLYITAVKGMRGPIEVPAKKKKGFMAKLKEKAGK